MTISVCTIGCQTEETLNPEEVRKMCLLDDATDFNTLCAGCRSLSLAENALNTENMSKVCLRRKNTTDFDRRSWEEMLRREFPHHRKDVARLNHGSFGSSPTKVLSAQASWQKKWLEQPDEFYYGPLEKGLLASRQAIASIIHAKDVSEVVLLDNVTTAASIIAQDIAWGFIEGRFKRGDAILMLNCSYAAVKKCFEAYAVRAGATILEVDIHLPLTSTQEILSIFTETLKEALRDSVTIRLAVIDHITSMPSVLLPVKELVRMCREAGVEYVFVDGAHSIGNIQLDVEEIDADYYSSNLHKWMFVPASVAFLHTKSQHVQRLHHPVVSHNYGNDGLAGECSWVGTRDYSAQLAVTSAVEFVSQLGGIDFLSEVNHRHVVEMGNMLSESWGTECGTSPELATSMVMVRLPDKLGVRSERDALDLRTRLRHEFDVEAPVCFQERNKASYVRVSHQIYNKLEEYIRLRDAVLELCS